MNNKILIGAVIAIVAIIGIVIVLKKSNIYSQQTPSSTTNQSSSDNNQTQTTQPTSPQNNNLQYIAILTQNGFSPATITVEAGTEVIFLNESGSAATVNSSKHPTHTDYAPLNLGNFSDRESLSLIFDESGTYKYHNHLNSSETGSVVVQ